MPTLPSAASDSRCQMPRELTSRAAALRVKGRWAVAESECSAQILYDESWLDGSRESRATCRPVSFGGWQWSRGIAHWRA